MNLLVLVGVGVDPRGGSKLHMVSKEESRLIDVCGEELKLQVLLNTLMEIRTP